LYGYLYSGWQRYENAIFIYRWSAVIIIILFFFLSCSYCLILFLVKCAFVGGVNCILFLCLYLSFFLNMNWEFLNNNSFYGLWLFVFCRQYLDMIYKKKMMSFDVWTCLEEKCDSIILWILSAFFLIAYSQHGWCQLLSVTYNCNLYFKLISGCQIELFYFLIIRMINNCRSCRYFLFDVGSNFLNIINYLSSIRRMRYTQTIFDIHLKDVKESCLCDFEDKILVW
jgi:hypothetical protein